MKPVLFTLALLFFYGMPTHAQNVTMAKGGKTNLELIKDSELSGFSVDGNRYFLSGFYKTGQKNHHLTSFNADGSNNSNLVLDINPGSFNNSFTIKEVLPVGNTVYALVEHLDKPSGKNRLLARTVDASGKVSKSETELMSLPFQKTMNSGYNNTAISPDRKILAVVSEMPFEKAMPGVFKIALYGEQLNKIAEDEVNMPGENIKNKNISIAVANNGTVYIVKKTSTKKGETALDILQWSSSNKGNLLPYSIELEAPNNIFSYTFAASPSNELILSGTYYERRTVSTGEKKIQGVFYFTNKGLKDGKLTSFAFGQPVENLTAEKILVEGSTVFLAAGQYKKEKETPPAGTANLDFNYTITHKNNHIIGMDLDGNRKFDVVLNKDFTARNFDHQHRSGFFLCNGKLTVLYNDHMNKYIPSASAGHIIPVLVQITSEGLMQEPVVFMDKLKLPAYAHFLPSFSVQDNEQKISVLMRNGNEVEFVNLTIE